MRIILDANASIDQVNQSGYSAIMRASLRGKIYFILLQSGSTTVGLLLLLCYKIIIHPLGAYK